MNIKKILALALALLMIAACASCKGNEEVPDEPIEAETAEAIDPDLTADYTDDEETRDRVQALQATFVNAEETPETEFTVTTANGKATVTAYVGTRENVRVPASIGSAEVTAIADGAFAGKETLKTLYLPDGITSIGEGILKDCTALTALRTPLMGKSATEKQYLGYLFGAAAHTDNPRDVPATLVYLELGGTATSLPDFALFDCNDLLVVTLPDCMTSIGTYALYNCGSLITLNTSHLTALSEHALDACTSLTVLDLGNLTSIGLGALEGCAGLRRVTLPFIGDGTGEHPYLGYVFGATVPEFSRGHYPSYLVEVTLLEGCEALGNYAFYECESLTALTLPDTVASIGIRAFDGCIRLSAIAIPSATVSIGENAFFDCISLEEVTFAENAVLTSIGMNAFYRCSALTEIALPQSLTALPASCFADCLNLRTVDLASVRTVGAQAFRRCQSLEAVNASGEVAFEEGNCAAEELLK